MTTIIDPELTVRLGALPAGEAARIDRYATAAFLWRGLRQDEALDVARGLHWRAVGRDPTAPATEVVAALALHPLAGPEQRRLAAQLDERCRLDHGDRATGRPVEDLRRTGRRLALAVNLLDTARTIA